MHGLRAVAYATMTGLLAAALVGVGAPPAAAAAITSGRPLTSVTTTPDLNCAVDHEADPVTEFFGTTACGTLVTAHGTLYGPANIPAGGAASPRTTYTTVSQGAVTGTGTAVDPYRLVTTVLAGPSVRIVQTDSYVDGDDSYRTDVELVNVGTTTVSGQVYRAGDCYLGASDAGYGLVGPVSGAIACTADQTPTTRVERWVPRTPGSHYYHASYHDVWGRIGAQQPFPDTCLCNSLLDNGAGLSWPYSLAPGGRATFTHDTEFSGDRPLRVTKVADAASVAAGGTVGYVLTVHNPNRAKVRLATVVDDLPAGFTYVAGSTSGITTSAPAVSGQRLTWSTPVDVGPRSSVDLYFRANVGSSPGRFPNDASATAPGLTVTPFTGAEVDVRLRPTLVADPAVLEVPQAISSANPEPVHLYLFTLHARLRAPVVGAVPGRPVVFSSDGTTLCTATTNATGDATCSALLKAVDVTLAFGYTATFAGDAWADPAVAAAPLVRVLGRDLP